MCRLIGFASPRPTTLAEVVGPMQCSTFQHLSRLHADGWGTMWLGPERSSTGNLAPALMASARINVTKSANPGQSDDVLTAAMAEEPSRGRVVHLRMATDGMTVRYQNSHPFVVDGIGLAHNGSIVPTGILRDSLSPTILADVSGDTDSELYLAAIRQGVRAGLSLSEAAYETVNWLRGYFPRASLNALVMSPTEFVAVHASTESPIPRHDFAARGLNATDLPMDHIDAYYSMSYLRHPDGTVAFASTGIDRTGWTPLPDESVTTVDLRSFEMTTRELEPVAGRSVA
ncbi:MAG: glucosamine--fructose-6-phosphate aminotransferase [Glaciihabitans sp.]|nr:glucosamine--fructose-6-phosphate aminotransferase [Glaciihabitans sp.]